MSINQTEYKGFIIQVSDVNVYVFTKPTSTQDGRCAHATTSAEKARAWVDARG